MPPTPPPAPKGAPKPAPAPAPAPKGIDIFELMKLDPEMLRGMADVADRKAGKTPPVVVADPAVAAAAAETAKKALDKELNDKREAAKKADELVAEQSKSSRRKWLALKLLIVAIMVFGAWMLGNNAGRHGMAASLTVGQTTVPIMPSSPDLTRELEASKLEAKNLRDERDALVESHRTSIADVQSQLRSKSNELNEALKEANTLRTHDDPLQVAAALLQRDRANQARDNALAEVAEIKSSMATMASVHSAAVAQLRLEHTATVAAIESRLNQAKARELAAKDATIAQLQQIVQSQRLDTENLRFAAQGSTVPANGLVNVEILTPAIPRGNRFSVQFVQRRELNFEVVVNNPNLETQTVVQVPPGLYSVTRLVDGRPFGNPVDTMIWPGNHRSWFQFGNNGVWHAVERNNPFITFWNGVGERRSTLPNGQVRLVNGDMVTIENGRVVNK